MNKVSRPLFPALCVAAPPFLAAEMSCSVFDSVSSSKAMPSIASLFALSPKPAVPSVIVIMSSLGTSAASSLSISSVLGDTNCDPISNSVAGHVAGSGPSPEPGSTTAMAVEVDEGSCVSSVWTLEHVVKSGDCRANQTWKCLWCNMTFKHWNATKVLYHLTKVTGHDVRICKASHDGKSKELYRSMLNEKDKVNAGLQNRLFNFKNLVGEGQQSLAVMFEKEQKRGSKSGGGTVANGGTMNTGRTRVFASEMTVEASQASQLTMAIADFVHSSGLPFTVTQSVYFQNILKFAHGVPSAYKGPTRNAISGSLLKINYNRQMER